MDTLFANSLFNHLNISHSFLILLLASTYLPTAIICLGDIGVPSTSTVEPLCIEEERRALVSFKQHLVDPSGRLSSWVGHDCCQWEGVSCNNSTGRVVKMDLRNPYPYFIFDEEWDNSAHEKSCLGGKINASLLSLKHLKYLDLSYNDFQGTRIPMFFGELKSLQYLNLSLASFEGEIPPSLGNLSSLNILDLGFNGFNVYLSSRNLNWLSHLSSLKYLNLNYIDLSPTGVNWAYDINMLPSLLELHLFSCQIESIPFSLQRINFTSLLFLGMSNNNFKSSSFPNWFFNLTSLITLKLSQNNFSNPLPNEFANFKSLEHLHLYNASLKGQIPESMGQLPQLVSLDLSENSLEGNVTEALFINLTRLQDFRVGIYVKDKPMPLTFDVADDWIPPFKLHTITIQNCHASPGFWRGIQTQTELTDITLRDIGISDTMPKEWLLKISSQVSTLDLSYNQFHGNFLSHLKFPSLQVFDLSHNQLEGPLPLWWSTKVLFLYLNSNLFVGPIPSNIGQMMPNLIKLFFSENQLNGSIPPSLCNMQQLQHFSLRSNQFSGELPHAWSVGSNMFALDVGHNNLSGNIPTSLGVLSYLTILDLNNNNFRGEIPVSLQNCSSLMILDLGQNKLSGNIPLWIGGSNVSLYRLQLRSNFFTGHIPQQLCNLQNLHILDLSHNNFSGTIPTCLNNLTLLVNNTSDGYDRSFLEQATLTLKGQELVFNNTLHLVKSIDLSSNKLEGEIPEEISSLILLGTLNLSMNQLTGNIPSKIGNLHLIETLDLSQNHLSGQIPQSLSSLNFLSHLNLSYNNLSGRIPFGNQLQTLNDLSIYMDNPSLCGVPLSTKCPEDDTSTIEDANDKNEDGNDDKLWFYISVVLGFIVGFWGVCGTLILKTSWRYAYFQFFDNFKENVALAIALKVARFRSFFYRGV